MSTKITELPAYVGSNNPPGVIPISINGVTYKLYPNQLADLQSILEGGNTSTVGISIFNPAYGNYTQINVDSVVISADVDTIDNMTISATQWQIVQGSTGGSYLYADVNGLEHSNANGTTQVHFEAEENNETVTIPNKSGLVCVLNVSDNYPDDGHAQIGGINIGDFYHTDGIVKIRLS